MFPEPRVQWQLESQDEGLSQRCRTTKTMAEMPPEA